MDGMSKVMQRMAAIEQRFGMAASTSVAPENGEFAAALKQATAVNEKSYDPSTQDVVKMLQFSAKQHGVDPKLALAVAKTESNFSPNVVSSAGAIGVMQLMPDTAKGLGVKDPFDARQNVDGGVRYLKELLGTFGGDVKKAVAAYNAGPQAVQSYGGVPPYSETQNYVNKVMADCQ
ncbi:lytic transglycosylase domain-containing protein [Azotosporobacter soli]|uniref:lytic transglycosylase domain-containing protein n=1 Tax=Azotosporobacter soli TaxID=3055040 RepID=UPI0031FE8D32